MYRLVEVAMSRLQGSFAPHAVGAVRDGCNRVRWGTGAPRFAERIFIDPSMCCYSLRLGSQTWSSGRVTSKANVFHHRLPIREEPVIAGCLQHWTEGVSWDETGLVSALHERVKRFGVYDHCRSLADIRARYARLDELYRTVSIEGRLRARVEVEPRAWREMNGILVHIGPSGELFFGGNGNHRLALALALGLDKVPVQLGGVYLGALDRLDELRNGLINEV